MIVEHAASGEIHASEAVLRANLVDLLDAEGPLGDDDNLFELGLDSIRLMLLTDRLRQAGLAVTFQDLAGQPRLRAWRDLLRTCQPRQTDGAAPAIEPPLTPVDPHAPFALTPIQQAYWIGRGDDQPLGGVGCHAYLELDGPPAEAHRLEAAVHALIRRHGMLRARFLPDGTQQISDASPWPGLTVHDLARLDEAAAAARAARLREKLSHRRLDVARGEVFDVTLTLLPNGVGRLHLNIDLLVCDVLSIRLLLGDLAELYDDPNSFAPLDYSFPQYLTETAPYREAELEAARTYWLERVPTLPGAPALPLAHDPVSVTSPRFRRRSRVLPADLWSRLTRRAAAAGLTPACVLATAFAAVLARWSGEDRFLLNIPLFNRRVVRPAASQLVADFTSLVPLEVDLGRRGGFAEQAARLQRRLHDDVAHGAFSGVEVLRELMRREPQPDGGARTAPVVFACNLDGGLVPDGCRKRFGDLAWMLSQTPQVWLDHQVYPAGDGLLLAWDAVEDLFPQGVLDAMFDAYLDLLASLATSSWLAAPWLPLPATQARAREQVITDWSHRPRTLQSGFFERAAKRPLDPALRWGSGAGLSYGELAASALRIGGALCERGVRRGDLVAVSLSKGPDQIAAVLGVLAAGAGYVPIGREQPDRRRALMLATAQPVLVLVGGGEETERSGGRPATLGVERAARATPLAAPARVDPDDTAYVIFTSGSTGTPKGVRISHAAVTNTVDDLNERLGAGPGDAVLAVSALDFDLSVWDVFGALTVGAVVVLVDEADRRDPRAWLELIRRHDVTLWNSVPVLLEMLLAVAGDEPLPESLRCALLSGDWIGLELPPRLARASSGRCSVLALGGATECSIWSNAYELLDGAVPAGWGSIPYGFPLRDQRFRVVDAAGRDCPDWVAGELWIGGAGVACGYHSDPELTARRFVPHEGLRWYRTGDLGRYRPGGLLEFLGRQDHQVKINGHRVELGEIEAALCSCTGVDAAVVVRTSAGRLAALVTGRAAAEQPEEPGHHRVTEPALRAQLAELLPEHMRPALLVVAPTLPLNANGKIDRSRAASMIDEAGTDARPNRPIRPGLEELVAEEWGRLLGQRPAGPAEGFFTAGGDSLLATRLVARLQERTGAEVPMRDLFRNATAEGLAEVLASRLALVSAGSGAAETEQGTI